ncbi:T-complex protein 1 theta subunit [Jimgerdemannia flammicorona]|uniref:CCT-theta n=2 Tax=Jimgerdemannia flammicorona TaxID=994334 RepID=A0A433D568_9FUNG|nr:T-complex protein 1 theta subunit [Jimgerdemannia flammicorona]RUS26542.1 hypothetical protein BC938DRAFT_470631 [Jimgerdemannia flammicorona]
MALRVPKSTLPQLFKEGYKFSQGVDEAVLRNIEAVHELAEIVRTSLGPNGRNKMVINHLEKLFVTNDAATIIRELEVVHPAAKLLVMASQQQEAEVGDATNFVVVFAGELLQNAEYLLRMGLHPSEIVQGYELAREKTLEILEGVYTIPSMNLSYDIFRAAFPILILPRPIPYLFMMALLSTELAVDKITDLKSRDQLLKPVRTAIAAKQFGHEELLSNLVIEAVLSIMPKNPKDFNVDNVRVVKIMGSSVHESRVVRGMVFGREPEVACVAAIYPKHQNICPKFNIIDYPIGVIHRAEKAKVGIFTCPLDIAQTETKGTVLIHNAAEMLNFTKGEESHMEKIFKELADSGVKVVVTGGGVGELALHYLNRFDILVVKVLSKFDLRRLCRVTGATALARLGAPTPEEMGFCDVIETIEIGGDRVTVFRQEDEKSRTVTIVLRGATSNHLDDIERAVDDGVNVVKAVTKDGRLVPGAGATEMELNKRLLAVGERTPGLNQHSIKKFAEALEVIPRTLAENAGLDATEVLSKLYAAHYKEEDGGMAVGVDVEVRFFKGFVMSTSVVSRFAMTNLLSSFNLKNETDGTQDAVKAGIYDVLTAKYWGIKYATDAALTILRVDQIIMSKPAGGPKPPKNQQNWDED